MSRRWLYGAVVIMALIACLVGGVFFYGRPPSSTSSEEAQRSSEALHETWERGAKEVIREYKETQNPVEARDRLLSLRVPTAERESHLALVLALEAFIQKRRDAEGRWQRAIEPFSPL